MDAYTYVALPRENWRMREFARQTLDCAAGACMSRLPEADFSDINGIHLFTTIFILSNGFLHDAVLEYLSDYILFAPKWPEKQ